MQDILHPLDRAPRDVHVGEVAFQEVDAGNVIEIATFAGNQTVNDADRVAAAHELFSQVRSDESCAAGDEKRSHSVEVRCKS